MFEETLLCEGRELKSGEKSSESRSLPSPSDALSETSDGDAEPPPSSVLVSLRRSDPVVDAMTKALLAAAEAGDFATVAQLANELRARGSF